MFLMLSLLPTISIGRDVAVRIVINWTFTSGGVDISLVIDHRILCFYSCVKLSLHITSTIRVHGIQLKYWGGACVPSAPLVPMCM